ncbi:hypothetical protein FLJC2902T_20450 [Flavobacterium limnosediminis JC2902]|uniref:Uncharacterized protein n=1 Tax=Flavobacterium limnosediminis JC2902 TaxID=1341181 RepID=V6SL69_9FLAO|nr:hypothetical protein FLJC2902T_20450 [Flavobacterium limnosediminis JC2902]
MKIFFVKKILTVCCTYKNRKGALSNAPSHNKTKNLINNNLFSSNRII